VLGHVDAALNAAGGAMKSAGSALMKSKAEAEAQLEQAYKELERAKVQVARDLQVFSNAKAKVINKLSAAVVTITMHKRL